MAKVELTVAKTLKPNEISDAFDFESASANDEVVIPFTGKDHQIYIIATATAACTLNVKAGNGVQGIADRDLALTENKYHFFTLDSGYHKNVAGENKGNVVIVPSAACNIAVVEARV